MPANRSTPGANPDAAEHQLPLRITVLRPPAGVQLCLQRGHAELVSPTLSTGDDVSFDLSVRVRDVGPGSPPRFLGPFVQGPTAARFVYVCIGTLAGQADSPWTRRAKVPLAGITWDTVRAALAAATPSGPRILQARYDGTARDGSPSCATVKLLDGWRLVM